MKPAQFGLGCSFPLTLVNRLKSFCYVFCCTIDFDILIYVIDIGMVVNLMITVNMQKIV